MKPPAVAASWHISFYSGCRFSRKAHPEAFPGDFGSHKEQTLISSPVTSLGTVNPLDFFSYLRAQWTSSPLRVYPGWPLHLGAWGGGQGDNRNDRARRDTEEMKRGPHRFWKDRRRRSERRALRARESSKGGAANAEERGGEGGGWGGWYTPPSLVTDKGERKEQAGEEEPGGTGRRGRREQDREGLRWLCFLWFVRRSRRTAGFKQSSNM